MKHFIFFVYYKTLNIIAFGTDPHPVDERYPRLIPANSPSEKQESARRVPAYAGVKHRVHKQAVPMHGRSQRAVYSTHRVPYLFEVPVFRRVSLRIDR